MLCTVGSKIDENCCKYKLIQVMGIFYTGIYATLSLTV